MKEPVTENFGGNEPTLHNKKTLRFLIMALLLVGVASALFNQRIEYGLSEGTEYLLILNYLYSVNKISLVGMFSSVALLIIFGYKKWLLAKEIALYFLVVSVLVLSAIAWTLSVLGLPGD